MEFKVDMALKNQTKRCSESGFSLITISIALAILGIMMVPAIHMYNLNVKAERLSRNKTSVALASSAINKYFLMHGEYPTPATPGNAMGTADFGHSATEPGTGWPSCQAGATPDNVVCSTTLNTLSGGAVLIGVVPFAELNIPFSSVLDANKNLITYAVTDALTDTTTYTEGGGQIIVRNSLNNPIYAAGARSHYVVTGHGDDSRGAFGLNGARNIACGTDADSDDFQNCDKDGAFRSNLVTGTVLTQVNDGAGAEHFDDYVQEKNSSASGIWSQVHNPLMPDLSISDRVGGNVATGNCDGRVPCTPLARLDIYGNGSALIPAARATSVRSARFCGRGNGSGDSPGSGGWGCINNYAQASNSNGADQTTCISGICPGAGATWSDSNLPPWVTPQLITGVPPVMSETGSYWLTTVPDHGPFHRGNGILCVGERAMNGIFDRDEACNNTSWVNPATQGRLGVCGTGEYARGISSTGAFVCQTPAVNM